MTAAENATAPARPVRIAVVGAGPSGIFLAEALLKSAKADFSIDVIERLPTPYGLVRYGVAPDHHKMKSVITIFHKTLDDPRVRFLGNVTFGEDLTLADVRRYYDAVIYTVGASADRRLNIPGEELQGNLSATEFVAWYNGHPDHATRRLKLDAHAVAVVGMGNVAVDVTRILAKHVDELRETDIPHAVLEVLAQSQVRDIYVLGRRGPAQAKFTTKELRELGELDNADVIVKAEDLELDSQSAEVVAGQSILQRNLEVLKDFASRTPQGRPRRIHLRFFAAPAEVVGTVHAEQLKVERTVLDERQDALGTGRYELLDVQMVLRSVGYRGLPLSDVPFDARRHLIPNERGRVLVEPGGAPLPGQYVSGWIKRGPTGIIGTNKADSIETAAAVIEDLAVLPRAPEPDPAAVDRHLAERGVTVVGWNHWLTIDQREVQLGGRYGSPRMKLTDFEEFVVKQQPVL
ncbi:MAG: FAD/NAD(P)-binding protein [Vulcanimicrobiaceae bacterium]